jgi:carbamoyl-phosphate synthase large subunit
VTSVLVLGVGGNVSQGIQKALAASPRGWRVIAACVHPHSAGLHMAEQAYVSPYAADPSFVGWVSEVCEREGIVAVLSGVEEVLEALAPAADAIPARVIAAAPEILAIAHDKLATARWLADRVLPAPATASADDRDGVDAIVERGWPVLVKPRRGKGSAGVEIVPDAAALARHRGDARLVVQEHLAGEEFSVGCVCDADGKLWSSMAVRRELRHGTTVLAEAGAFPAVTAAAERIVSELAPAGPCNVQLRLRGDEPVAFEINARFSGTTPMRVRLGFDEVDAVVAHLALGEPMRKLTAPTAGLMVRYWEELYPAEADVRRLAAGAPLRDA